MSIKKHKNKKHNQIKKYRLLNYRYLNCLKLYNYEILKKKASKEFFSKKLKFKIRGSEKFLQLATAYVTLRPFKVIRKVYLTFKNYYTQVLKQIKRLKNSFTATALYRVHQFYNNRITEFGELWLWELYNSYYNMFCKFDKQNPLKFKYITKLYFKKKKKIYKPMLTKKLKFLNNYIKLASQLSTEVVKFRSILSSEYHLLQIRKTSNNICILIAKACGSILFWCTSGSKKFLGPKRSTFTANLAVARAVYFKMLTRQIYRVKIILRSSKGKTKIKHVLKVFARPSKKKKVIKILAFLNMTPISFNGCMKKKERR